MKCHINIWHDVFTCARAHAHRTHSYMTRLIHVCLRTHKRKKDMNSYLKNSYPTQRIHICSRTRTHDAFTYNMTHSLINILLRSCMTWLILWHDSFTYKRHDWLIHMWMRSRCSGSSPLITSICTHTHTHSLIHTHTHKHTHTHTHTRIAPSQQITPFSRLHLLSLFISFSLTHTHTHI